MNLFLLDPDHAKCAEYHVKNHVGKQILEAAQVMASAYPGTAPYKITHKNTSIPVWIRQSRDNFDYAIQYALALCREFEFRRGKKHKTETVINWYIKNPPALEYKGLTRFPRAFAEFKGVIPETDCIYTDYREYYRRAKTHLFDWENREKPDWI